MAVVSTPSPIIPISDEQFIARFLRGDRSALGGLFQRYREATYRVAYRLLGNEADALDAVQEGFIKALNHLDGFKRRSSFKTGLMRVVSNAALDLGRQRGRREARCVDEAGWPDTEAFAIAIALGPLQQAEQNDLRDALDAALCELPAPQRLTFVLHVDSGLNYREIADVMKVSVGTVMSRLFYARQKLKGMLSSWIRV